MTFIFANLSSFVKLASQKSLQYTTNLLRTLFGEFDEVCLKYNIHKLCTIGDCYVAMSSTKASKGDPIKEVQDVVYLGIEMVRIIRKFKKQQSDSLLDELDIRIGINTVFLFYLINTIYLLK